MKTIGVLLLGFLLISFNLKSQDLIFRTNGESLNCRITNVDSTKIYFELIRNEKTINTFLDLSEVSKYEFAHKKKSKESGNGNFNLSFDPLGFITMGPSICGEFLIQSKNAPIGFGILVGIRITNLGLASNLLMSGGDMAMSYTVPIALRFYPKTKIKCDGLLIGAHVEYGKSNFKNDNENNIMALGVNFGYKWVFNSGFNIELSDIIGVIQYKADDFTESNSGDGWSETITYEGTDGWETLAFVPYLVTLRLGIPISGEN